MMMAYFKPHLILFLCRYIFDYKSYIIFFLCIEVAHDAAIEAAPGVMNYIFRIDFVIYSYQ